MKQICANVRKIISAQRLLLKLHDVLKLWHKFYTVYTRMVAEARLTLANSSFRWRAATQYAALPGNLKTEGQKNHNWKERPLN